MLDKRAQILLKTLVERYIAEGQPIGSRTLTHYSGLDISAATIRNVMADLEEKGFITSPHTSAGRVPTPLGYRFFVDSLLTIKQLASEELHQLEDNLHQAEPQRLITSASQLLSELTHFAGVVIAPKRQEPVFHQIEFINLSEKRVLLIIVTPEGDVQNRILLTDKNYSSSELIQAANFLNQNYAGCTFTEIRSRIHGELKQIHEDISRLMAAALEAGSQAMADTSQQYVISGENNLFDAEELASNMKRLRELFELFEQKTGLMQLLEISNRAQGVQIFIGDESGLAPLDECSVVAAPYEVNGQVVGTVGVIGPTRMAYDRVIPIVDITAKLLASALSK